MKDEPATGKTTFECFRSYCQGVSIALNEVANYSSVYRVVNNKFMKEHDGQYLEIEYRSECHLIRINILYSLAYRIPIFYFMVYGVDDSKPFSSQQIYQQFFKSDSSKILSPINQNSGIYITQNPISKEYLYTLHSCQLKMEIQYLVPYYLSLLGLHPEISIHQS